MHTSTQCIVLPANSATVDDVEAADWIMDWANECLRDALQFGPMASVPVFKRALEHAASAKFGQRMKVALAPRSRIDRGRSVLPQTFVITTVEGRPAAA